jgi:hypothetical protein
LADEDRRLETFDAEGVVWVGVPWPLTDGRRPFGGLACWPCRALRVIRLSPLWSSIGTVLMRPDFRRPSWATNVDGPSASTFFHGGDSGLGRRDDVSGVESRTRRRFAGGPSSIEFGSCAWPLATVWFSRTLDWLGSSSGSFAGETACSDESGLCASATSAAGAS